MGDYVRHRCRGDDPRPTLQGYRGTCQPAIRSAGSHPCRWIRQTAFASHRQQRVAIRVSQHAETFLRCAQNDGRLHTIRHADGSNEIRQSERVQRLEQLDRYFHGRTLCCLMRNYRKRNSGQFRGRFTRVSRGAENDLRGSQSRIESLLWRLSFCGRFRRHIQSFQPAQYFLQNEVRQLLVWNGDTDLLGGIAQALPLRLGTHGKRGNQLRCVE